MAQPRWLPDWHWLRRRLIRRAEKRLRFKAEWFRQTGGFKRHRA
jgi:hypothetical protein